MSISETDLAWIAGIFDFRYPTIQRANQHGRKLTVLIWNKDFRVIDKLNKLTGSNVSPRKTAPPLKDWMARGCSEHCTEKHVEYTPMTLPKHQWKLNGVSAAIILHSVMPYMQHADDLGIGSKIEETFGTIPYTGSGSTTVRRIIQKFAHLGWEIPDEVLELAITGPGSLTD